ncbi:hypothetical protein BO70DRAFT_360117 [Aspergillus heteromorphus CBS 117.55]|uniref:Uncharacterized protein n=1 Tax=Aspergillus heteromorphus CBS 117.55 TaxID=1448321 RepID=A0A317WLY2_9EURO|nr:uncharacterized protein BO70DRAFT_360117 [Aspergillus heteromorphus CBS 117.55]PWY87506.1 hypothetical protein BO70DRAFT_360117 [Aspergillus heteromorphus CBS 117.55]
MCCGLASLAAQPLRRPDCKPVVIGAERILLALLWVPPSPSWSLLVPRGLSRAGLWVVMEGPSMAHSQSAPPGRSFLGGPAFPREGHRRSQTLGLPSFGWHRNTSSLPTSGNRDPAHRDYCKQTDSEGGLSVDSIAPHFPPPPAG